MLFTNHKIYYKDARIMDNIDNDIVDLVVTSPPYPMIEMWDKLFSSQNNEIKKEFDNNIVNPDIIFELMHLELEHIWVELCRVVKPGGIVCINIGDATRTINNKFKLYPSHSKIIEFFLDNGFDLLPSIIWKKTTNSPTKFMGSGMMPVGAYVTLGHEYILIFRKGERRKFITEEEKINRLQSAYFWEERNIWFSDIWDIKGVKQKLNDSSIREKSAAYPFDIAYRLINMFSVKGDIILDPFLGTGTTMFAAIAANRNSIGFEINKDFDNTIKTTLDENFINNINKKIKNRFLSHDEFIKNRYIIKGKDCFKYKNKYYNFPVMTLQEKELIINYIKNFKIENNNEINIEYHKPYSNYLDLI